MTDLDTLERNYYLSLSKKGKKKYLKIRPMVILDERSENGYVIWTVDISKKLKKLIQSIQLEGESLDDAASRFINEALRSIISEFKEKSFTERAVENGELKYCKHCDSYFKTEFSFEKEHKCPGKLQEDRVRYKEQVDNIRQVLSDECD